jgi:Ni/Fe-hydrogenase 1 B-type cytochrome subunit
LSTIGTPSFDERHSLAIRIWHWLFFVLLASTITIVGLATFVFDTRANIPLVQGQLQEKGVHVNADQASSVPHAFNDLLWGLHTWIGYFIAAFVVGRLVLEAFQPGDERLGVKIGRAMGFIGVSAERAHAKKHYLRVKWAYIVFYAAILVMAITGVGLALEDVPIFRSMRGGIKSVHSFTQYVVYAFIVAHLVGVIAADAGKYPGLVSGMIGGKKKAQ